MTKTSISIAALALAVAAISSGAYAKQTPNQVTAQLNQQQVQGVPIQTQSPDQYPAPPQVYVDPAPAPVQDTTTNVVIAAPPHNSTEAFGQPDTNPQSTGMPSTDQPYVAVVPAPNGQTDDDPAPQ